jgi:hypothetical protein
MCDRCPELEARIEALLDELHDLNVAACDRASVAQAEARAAHPATRDDCPPHGIARPLLTLVKTEAPAAPPGRALSGGVETPAPVSAPGTPA